MGSNKDKHIENKNSFCIVSFYSICVELYVYRYIIRFFLSV